jgi:hypothetical protein
MHSEETSIGVIKNYSQLVTATNGLYGSLANMLLDYQEFYIPNFNGDDLNTGTPNYNIYYAGGSQGNFCYQAGLGLLFSSNWQLLYSTIASTNNLLKQYNLALIKDIPTKEVLGEIFLIRAYCYFRLTRTYGQIPIIKDVDISYTVSKNSFTDIYGFIENDLRKAMELLPKNNNFARIPFITTNRGSAKAILAELYLNWGGYPIKDISKYGLAAKEAGETIDSASYFGFALLNDFANVWDTTHIMNSESVFSLYFPNVTNLSQAILNNAEFPYQGYSGMYPQFTDSTSGIFILFFPTEVNFFNNYPAGYRKEVTFFKTIYVPNYLGTPPNVGYISINKVTTCSRIAFRKFYYQCKDDKNTTSLFRTVYGIPRVYIFRFAQTLLTYAEAMSRSGQQPNAKAYECINQIRRRAHQLNLNTSSVFDLPAGLPASSFADSVVQERAWELCGEPEGRWFDLLRLEMVEDLPKLRNPSEGGPPSVFDKSVYFLTIPATDTLLNPNLSK